MNPGFNIGREVGNNFGKTRQAANDESVIESILSNAMNTGDPAVLQQSIGKIISQVSPERQGIALQYLQGVQSNLQKKQELAKIEARDRQAALDAGYTYGAPPAVQAQQAKDRAKSQRLSEYGLSGIQNQPGQMQPPASAIPMPGQAPQAQPPQVMQQPQKQESGFRSLSDDDLVKATGHPDREVSEPAKAEWERRKDERKLAQKEIEEKSKNERYLAEQALKKKEFFHNETKKFDDDLSTLASAAEKKNRALERQMKDVDKIGWWDRIIGTVFGDSKYGDLLRSSNAQQFDANVLPQMEGQRQILGGILSDSDIRLLLQKIVTSTKDPEANKVIAKSMQSENDLVIAKQRIGQEIKRKNDGYRPADYNDEIERIYKERYGDQIQEMFNSVMALPDDPKKLAAVGRRKVPPGTPLTTNVIDMYLEIANNDPAKARKLAEEDNYDIPR